MNDISRLKEQQRGKHPGFDSYLECMTRSLLTGLASFCLGFSAVYFAQKSVQSRLSYPLKYNILVSALTASLLSYKITSYRTQICQNGWVDAEKDIKPKKEKD